MKRLAAFFALFYLIAGVGPVFAYDIPNFTSCVNPQGQIKANYDSGTHGIVGSNATYEGKDTVYTLSSSALTQCFCASDGKGIQTNWWKVNLRESEIEALKSQGWIYVPGGASWGLEDSQYMAKNSDFSCKGNSSSGGTSNSVSSNSDSGGSNSNQGGVSGGIGQVLGLASTGNSIFLLGTALTSGLSLLLGLILKKRAKNGSNLHV